MNDKHKKLFNEMTNPPPNYKYISDVSFQLSEDTSYYKGIAIIDHLDNLYLFEKKSMFSKGYEEQFDLNKLKILTYKNQTLNRNIILVNPNNNFQISIDIKDKEFLNYLINNVEDIINAYQKLQSKISGSQNTLLNTYEKETKEIDTINEKRVLKKFFITGPQHQKDLMDNLKEIRKLSIRDRFDPMPYEGLSNKELKQELIFVDRIYQFSPTVFSENIEFVNDTENEFDENALLVKVYGLPIGWVLKKHQKKVREMLNKNYKFHGLIRGGNYKTYDFDEDKTITIKSELSFYIEENYKQDDI